MVAGRIGIVNPFVNGTIMMSDGTYATQPDGTRVPNYETIPGVPMQVQALTVDDLKKAEGLNIQGIRQAIYLNGNWSGVDRVDKLGGDLIVLDGKTWLVTMVLESWPDWCKVMVTLQNEGTP